MPPQTIWLQEFSGRHDSISPGATPKVTPDLRNVKFNFGSIAPRGGMKVYQSVAATTSGPFVGLFSYPTMSGTNYVVRMTGTGVEYFDGAAWTDFTGTALNGDANTRPQSTIIDDTLVFTNEGNDHPSKWEGPSNLSVVIGNGSTPPYCKALESYLGFLMAGNISDDASFTDLFDGPRSIRYADDWDNDWSGCVGNEVVLNETPGALLAMKVLGRDLICYKVDGIVRVRWVGGQIRFTQEKLPFGGGILSPLSLQSINDQAHIFLGSDACVYLLEQNNVQAISNDELAETLPPLLAGGKLPFSRSFLDTTLSTYYLLFSTTSSINLDSFVSYNWRDKAWSSGKLATGIVAQSGVQHQETSLSPLVLLIASDDLIGVIDSNETDRDLAVRTERYYTTNWQGLGEEGYFDSARLVFKMTGENETNLDPFTTP